MSVHRPYFRNTSCSFSFAAQLDEFELDLGQLKLGEIQKVDIGYSTTQTMAGGLGGLFGKAWALESVEVLHFNTGNRTFFMYDDWLSGERRRVQLVPGKVGENNTYKVDHILEKIKKLHCIRGAVIV